MVITIHGGIYISIDVVFKKSVMPVLLMVAVILSLFATSNRVHAESEPNLALNPSRIGYPQVTASYTCCSDNAWNAVDGVYSFNRWTNWPSSNQTDSFTIDFGSVKAFNQVKLYIYNDTGGVQPPASYTIQYWDGVTWIDTTHQTKSPEIPNAAPYTSSTTPDSILNTDNFDTVSSSKLQVVFTKSAIADSGIVEIEVYLQTADTNAASAIATQIEQLPLQAAVALSHKTAIVATRTAYTNLTASQKSLVTNLSKLTAAEAAIVTLQAAQAANESAATAMMTQIGQLPLQAAVSLSDKSAITAVRTAYNNLTESQKSLVTNVSKLTAAEAAIVVLEAALIPGVKDVTVLSAFSDPTGRTITLKLSSVLDATYSMQASKFQITANAVSVSVASALYDSADSSHRTIKLTLSTPALLNATMAALSLQSGALKTNNNELNNTINSIPIITFKNLDLSHDNRIGVEDVVLMIGNPASQIDVNQDGIFNRQDILIILGQISMHLR